MLDTLLRLKAESGADSAALENILEVALMRGEHRRPDPRMEKMEMEKCEHETVTRVHEM